MTFTQYVEKKSENYLYRPSTEWFWKLSHGTLKTFEKLLLVIWLHISKDYKAHLEVKLLGYHTHSYTFLCHRIINKADKYFKQYDVVIFDTCHWDTLRTISIAVYHSPYMVYINIKYISTRIIRLMGRWENITKEWVLSKALARNMMHWTSATNLNCNPSLYMSDVIGFIRSVRNWWTSHITYFKVDAPVVICRCSPWEPWLNGFRELVASFC